MHTNLEHWWDMHKGNIEDWDECNRMMRLHFEKPTSPPMDIFGGRGDSCKNLATWMEVWDKTTRAEWVHMFVHTLGPIPTAWYLEMELRRWTLNWVIMSESFQLTFGMAGGSEGLDEALQDIEALLFDDSRPQIECVAPSWEAQMEDIIKCRNLSVEDNE